MNNIAILELKNIRNTTVNNLQNHIFYTNKNLLVLKSFVNEINVEHKTLHFT